MRILIDNPVLRDLRASMPNRFWCDGKQRHPSKGAAEAQLRSLLRRANVYDPEHLSAYRCKTCLCFHVGHRRDSK